jgi:hypothetical protein
MLCSMLRAFDELVLVEGCIADESGRFLAFTVVYPANHRALLGDPPCRNASVL